MAIVENGVIKFSQEELKAAGKKCTNCIFNVACQIDAKASMAIIYQSIQNKPTDTEIALQAACMKKVETVLVFQ
jgi:hypothetical protein